MSPSRPRNASLNVPFLIDCAVVEETTHLPATATVARMALTSFSTWFSSPTPEVESDSPSSSNADEHATSDSPDMADENQPPSSPLRITFTSTQVKQRPRAWQRKPATPFAPRSNSQKIWKRFPLQNVTSNVNTAWERGGKTGDGIMRPVKKLRVAPVVGKGNDSIGSSIAKWDREVSPEKMQRRSQPNVQRHVVFEDAEGTANVEDAAEASPPPETKNTAFASGEGPENAVQENAGELPDSEEAHASVLDGNKALADAESLFDLSQDASDKSVDIIPAVGIDPIIIAVQQSNRYVQNDEDDASYLQAFLSRSRAQREARSQPCHSHSPVGTKVSLAPAELQLPSIPPAEEEPTSSMCFSEAFLLPAKDETDGDQESREATEAQASSPCRRSSRITRLPRPQRPIALPNTISLRRLNGNEFIAMQKIDQSLALATRANTKKNKGTAMNVRQRLIQLQAEKHPFVDDQRQPSGKGVAWSETIARMQSEDGSEVTYVPEPIVESDFEATPEEDDKVEEEITAAPKPVRRRRKDSLGNANGTPAPKKTVELLLESTNQSGVTEEQMEIPQPTPIKRTRTRART